uniref:Uncharacterized protein n=1 Tax=Romanomermis culicivorax TaxID=13658 RepID=A0A915JLA8_ROMCU
VKDFEKRSRRKEDVEISSQNEISLIPRRRIEIKIIIRRRIADTFNVVYHTPIVVTYATQQGRQVDGRRRVGRRPDGRRCVQNVVHQTAIIIRHVKESTAATAEEDGTAFAEDDADGRWTAGDDEGERGMVQGTLAIAVGVPSRRVAKRNV